MSRRKQIALTTLVPCQRLHIITFYQARKKKSKQREKFRFRAARAPESVCKGKQLLPSTETKPMKQFIHLKSTIIPWVRGPIRYSPLGGICLLVPLLFACFALSQTVEAANRAPATPATSASGGSIDGLRRFSNTDLFRAGPTIIRCGAPRRGPHCDGGVRWLDRWLAEFQQHGLTAGRTHYHHVRCPRLGYRPRP